MADFREKFKNFISSYGTKEESTQNKKLALMAGKKILERVKKGEISPLYALYMQSLDFLGIGMTIPLPQSMFEERVCCLIPQKTKEEAEFKSFFARIEELAVKKLETLAKHSELQSDLGMYLFNGAFGEKGKQIYLWRTNDKLQAFGFLFPTIQIKATEQKIELRKRLKEEKIVYGIDEQVIHQVEEGKCYFQFFKVAQGEAVIDGKDGEIIEHFKRVQGVYDLKQTEESKVSEALLKTQEVKKGTIICDIIESIEGKDGKTIYGEILKAKKAVMPEIPMGKHTVLSSDRTKLLAEQDGFVVYDFGQYHVRNIMVIPNDVDGSTGNVYYDGDIEIIGNVENNVTIEAKGSILIHGEVKGGKISAGGTITLNKNVIGGRETVLKAGEKIKGKLFENCQIYSETDVFADGILNSEVYAERNIYVMGESGIEQSTLMAGFCVEADRIGRKENSLVKVMVGSNYKSFEQKEKLETELLEKTKVLEQMQTVLKQLKNKPLNEMQKICLKKVMDYEKTYYYDIKNIKIKLEELETEFPEKLDGYLKARIVYPDVELKIAKKVFLVQNLHYQSSFHYLREKEYIVCESWK